MKSRAINFSICNYQPVKWLFGCNCLFLVCVAEEALYLKSNVNNFKSAHNERNEYLFDLKNVHLRLKTADKGRNNLTEAKQGNYNNNKMIIRCVSLVSASK